MASNPFQKFEMQLDAKMTSSPSTRTSRKMLQLSHESPLQSSRKRKSVEEERFDSNMVQPQVAKSKRLQDTQTSRPAAGMPERLGDPVRPLRCIIIGHNPSETTWQRGHAYAHPSNHMWRILIKTGIAPNGVTGPEDDVLLPVKAGVGFSDVGTGHPGTDSSAFHSSVFQSWSQDFYQRMRGHIAAASKAIGCECGSCGAPSLVAFSGKRHYMELLNINKKGKDKFKSVDLGLQPPDRLPPGWPFPASTQVWVCCSTSGASPLTHAQREAPYRAVADSLAGIPWPRIDVPRCPASGT